MSWAAPHDAASPPTGLDSIFQQEAFNSTVPPSSYTVHESSGQGGDVIAIPIVPSVHPVLQFVQPPGPDAAAEYGTWVGHASQLPTPPPLYLPGVQGACTGVVAPARQAYPTLQLPEQAAVARAVVLPKVPSGQGRQVAPAPREYRPVAQAWAWATVEPGGQTYPALQFPEQLELGRAGRAP